LLRGEACVFEPLHAVVAPAAQHHLQISTQLRQAHTREASDHSASRMPVNRRRFGQAKEQGVSYQGTIRRSARLHRTRVKMKGAHKSCPTNFSLSRLSATCLVGRPRQTEVCRTRRKLTSHLCRKTSSARW
jgi:hypothetical protein